MGDHQTAGASHSSNLNRNILILLGLVVFSIWVLIAYGVTQVRQDRVETATTVAQNMARSLAAHTEATFETISLHLQVIDETYSQMGPLAPMSSDVTAIMAHHVESSNALYSANIFDADGDMIQSAIPKPGGGYLQPNPINIVDREYFKALAATTKATSPPVFVGRPIQGRVTGEWIVPVARARFDDQSAFAGLVMFTVKLEEFGGLYKTFDLSSDASVALARKDGIFLARNPFAPLFFGKSFADNPFFSQALKASPHGVFEDPHAIDGKRRIIAYHSLENLPLTMVVTQTKASMVAGWLNDAMIAIVTGLMATVVLLYFARSLWAKANLVIQQRNTLEQQVADRTRELTIIGALRERFITEPDPYTLFDSLLKDIMALTGSEYGFIGDIRHKADGSPYLKCYAFSNISWNAETSRFYEENKATGFVFEKLDNLFGAVVTSGEVVISNDPDNDSRSAGRPPGHPPLRAFLGIPVFWGDKLVGEIGLANRSGGYDQGVIEQLAPITAALSQIITARWQLEERDAAELALEDKTHELEAARDEAEKANLAKSQFLASMSHELRTPLNAVLGFAQMMQFDPKNPLAPAQEEHVENILDGGRHLLELVNGILDLASIEADQLVLYPDFVNAQEIVEECITFTAPLAERRGIDIIDNFSAKPFGEVHTDRMRFKQAFLNLLSNAVKFNRDNGTVTIDGAEHEPGFLTVSVTDTGAGIPEKDQSNVFQMFHRAESDAMITQEGTGIGLFVSKLLMERMAGGIGFESREDAGSTFWLTLPLAANDKVVIWNEDLSVGVDAIDKDHQIIIKMMNQLAHTATDVATLNTLVNELIDYTKHHFRREEAVMEVCGYPDLEEHRRLHRELADQVTELEREWNAYQDPRIADRLRAFLQHLWVNHFLEYDRKIPDYAVGNTHKIRRVLEELN